MTHGEALKLAASVLAERRIVKARPFQIAQTLARALLEADNRADRAARELVYVRHIFNGHTVDQRGPSGCIWDALKAIAPEVAAEVEQVGFDAVYARRYSESDQPMATCPRCKAELPDYDGFGVVAHIGPGACGFWRHISKDFVDGAWQCGICGRRGEDLAR